MINRAYKLRRYYLSLSSFEGIVFGASHWFCRIRWTSDAGEDHEADAECGRGDDRSSRFNTKAAARAAGVRLVKRFAKHDDVVHFVITEGSHCIIDPQRVLVAPGNLTSRLNKLWERFEKLDGWGCAPVMESTVQKICDSWTSLIGDVERKP